MNETRYIDFQELDDVTPAHMQKWKREIIDKIKKDARKMRITISKRTDLSNDSKNRTVQLLGEMEGDIQRGMSSVVILMGMMDELKDNNKIENPEDLTTILQDVDIALNCITELLANMRNLKRNLERSK